ncbi:hypothetical protein RRG08_029359 [Elysia crispata]|uniref:Uncharacterized protein n=1 Tax=Elysia crispata TaxID=231223 RepID=A0AAE1B792_9GAST|nr:hypothetical protein RRG08_029359 [Elysia crispata]
MNQTPGDKHLIHNSINNLDLSPAEWARHTYPSSLSCSCVFYAMKFVCLCRQSCLSRSLLTMLKESCFIPSFPRNDLTLLKESCFIPSFPRNDSAMLKESCCIPSYPCNDLAFLKESCFIPSYPCNNCIHLEALPRYWFCSLGS